MFLRLRSSGFIGPKLPFGSFWIWKTFAPSPPSPSSMNRRRPVIIAIAAQTRPTPMTMPSKVSPARSLCPRSAPTARRASSPRARIVRRKPGRRCAGSDAIGRGRVDSLIPERLDGIERCRAPRRPQTEDETYRAGETDAREHDPRVHAGGERRHHRHHVRAAEPDGGAEEAADAAHHHRLAEELEEDGQLASAERPPDADLPRPLLHGDEQDVHHADAADERGDEADDVDDELHVARHVAEHVQHPVLAIDGEVVVLVRGKPAVVADDRHDLVLHLGDLSGGSHDGDGHAALLPEGTQERREREHDQHVLRLTEGVSLPDQGSDHRAAPDRTDAKLLPYRILIREEGVLDVGADDAGVATDLVIDVADEPAPLDLPASGLEEALGGAADEDVLEILAALADDALGTRDGRDGQRERRETLDGVPVALPARRPVAVLPPVVAVDDHGRGLTYSVFGPSEASWRLNASSRPIAADETAMTVAMPMEMPRIVSDARSLCMTRLRSACTTASRSSLKKRKKARKNPISRAVAFRERLSAASLMDVPPPPSGRPGTRPAPRRRGLRRWRTRLHGPVRPRRRGRRRAAPLADSGRRASARA